MMDQIREWICNNTDFYCMAVIGGHWQLLHARPELQRLFLDDVDLIDFARSKGFLQ
jgi:hypothetical protein